MYSSVLLQATAHLWMFVMKPAWASEVDADLEVPVDDPVGLKVVVVLPKWVDQLLGHLIAGRTGQNTTQRDSKGESVSQRLIESMSQSVSKSASEVVSQGE